jgi:hypothetical protein
LIRRICPFLVLAYEERLALGVVRAGHLHHRPRQVEAAGVEVEVRRPRADGLAEPRAAGDQQGRQHPGRLGGQAGADLQVLVGGGDLDWARARYLGGLDVVARVDVEVTVGDGHGEQGREHDLGLADRVRGPARFFQRGAEALWRKGLDDP